MKDLKRPDIKYSNKILSEIELLRKDIREIILDSEYLYKVVIQLYDDIQNECIEDTLRNIPIEKLNSAGKGFKLNVFKRAGINNFLELTKKTRSQLTQIQGIGDITAQQARAAAESMERTVMENVIFTIDLQKRTNNQTDMIKALYRINFNKDIIEKSKKIDLTYKMLQSHIKLVKSTQNKFKWLFSFNSKKEKAINSLNILSNFLNSSEVELFAKINDKYKSENQTVEYNYVWNDFSNNSAKYYSTLESIVKKKLDIKKEKGDLPEDLIKRVESLKLNKALLNSSLRGYQEFGAKYCIIQGKVLIGDEMGLGKTVEAIAAIAHLQAEGNKYFFVVCPASVLINWHKEIEKHSKLKSYIIHGADRDKVVKEWEIKGGVAITTYDTLKRIEVKEKIKLDLVVADEAHYVKNPSAQRTQALYNLMLHSNKILFMTGTPIENRVDEMINLINYLKPEIAKSLNSKECLYNVKGFRYKIAPVYLRRNQKDVLNELPKLIQIEEWEEFGTDERKVYSQAVREGNFMAMRQAAWRGGSQDKCPKLNRLVEICEEAKENNCKIIVFSFFRQTIAVVKEALGDVCFEPITGSITANKRQKIVDEFTAAPAGVVLPCQIVAGGVGLNIQAASVVILCEPQLKPALETQAIARAHRMGQVNKVVVYRLLTENSIDERMIKMLNSKQRIFDSYARDSVVVESSNEAVDITEKELIERIVSEEKSRLGYDN